MNLLFDFLLISGLVFNAIVLWLLWTRKNRTLPDRLLSSIFISTLLENIYFYGVYHDIDVLVILTYPLDDTLVFWLGPTLLLYVKSLHQPSDGLVKKHRPHYVFFLLYLVLVTLPTMISIFRGSPIFPYLKFIVESDWFYIIHMLFLLPYVLWSLRLVRRYRSVIKDNFSELDTNGFEWVQRFFIGILLVIGLDLSTSIYEISFGELNWNTGYLTIATLVVMIAYLGVHGVSQSRVLLPDFLLDRTGGEPSPPKELNSRNEYNLPEATQLAERLQEVLNKDEAFLDESLTLGKLAAMIPCTDKKLSLLLNQYLNTNFYDLINEHRVDAVREAMVDDTYRRRSIIEIAYGCGFKSKTSFNRVFKQKTGMTPGAYRDSIAGKAVKKI